MGGGEVCFAKSLDKHVAPSHLPFFCANILGHVCQEFQSKME